MREIGSEFWSVPTVDTENYLFPKTTNWFCSGRSALKAIIMQLQDCHIVSIPSWCCDSMIIPFLSAGMIVKYYPVYWKNGLVQEIDMDCDVLFLMDYFGYTSMLPELGEFGGVIIRDVTHSIFSYRYDDADFYFGSMRKWCGIWTGGFAWAQDGKDLLVSDGLESGYIELRQRAMQMKSKYIKELEENKEIEGVEKGYLNCFFEAEEILRNVDNSPASPLDIDRIKHLDIELIKKRRKTNAEVIRKSLGNWLVFPLMRDSDCPLFVPIIVPKGKRDELRQYLIMKKVYCPVHWPISEYHALTQEERYIYENELSIVCDQRYTESDMMYIVDTIKKFRG